jgi:hypothetical protein
MSQPPVKWQHVKRYFERRGYTFRSSGGDKIIIAPGPNSFGKRSTVRIGHHYCSHLGDELLPAHLNVIRRVFGVSRYELLGKKNK